MPAWPPLDASPDALPDPATALNWFTSPDVQKPTEQVANSGTRADRATLCNILSSMIVPALELGAASQQVVAEGSNGEDYEGELHIARLLVAHLTQCETEAVVSHSNAVKYFEAGADEQEAKLDAVLNSTMESDMGPATDRVADSRGTSGSNSDSDSDSDSGRSQAREAECERMGARG